MSLNIRLISSSNICNFAGQNTAEVNTEHYNAKIFQEKDEKFVS